jgi:mannose-6-phosphate isomerase
MPEEPLAPGDTFMLYAGTMHYSAGGMLLYEILQNSNAHVSLRRLPADIDPERRKYLVERARACVHIEPGADFRTAPVELDEGAARRTFLLACRYFAVERLDLSGPHKLSCDGTRLYVITQLEGVTRVRSGGREEVLGPGNTALLPARLGEVELAPRGRSALLKAYVPELRRDVVELLRGRGVPDERILGLGGRTRLNHLEGLL